LKIHKKQNKRKQLLSSLYVYRRYVNCGVGNSYICWYFRRSSHLYKAEARWTHCWWDRNNN